MALESDAADGRSDATETTGKRRATTDTPRDGPTRDVGLELADDRPTSRVRRRVRSSERLDPSVRARGSGLSRRRVLRTAGVAGLTVAGLATTSGAVSAGDERDVRWTFSAEGFVESSPTVVDGVVYVGDESGAVHAVDVATGRPQWSFQTGALVCSDAQVVDGDVYVGSTDGNVYAIDTASGEERWRFETGSYVNSSPTRVGDVVYVGSEDGNVYAIDAADGTERWRYTTGDVVTTAPTVVDGVVYVGSHDRHVYALASADGSLVWRYRTGLWVNAAVTVSDGVAYVGSDDSTLYALSATDGSLEWEFTDPDAHVISATTVHDGVVYVGTDDETYGVADDPTEAVLYAVDAATGTERWSFAVDGSDDADDWQFHASPTVADGVVYASNTNGTVYGLEAATGEVVWTYETRDAVWSSPTVVDGVLYVGSDDGTLYALETGGDGSSVDSRVELGTLGHHDEWATTAATAETPTALPDVSNGDEDDGTNGADRSAAELERELADAAADDGGQQELVEVDLDGVPGMGVTASLASLGGVSYVLKRRLDRLEGASESKTTGEDD